MSPTKYLTAPRSGPGVRSKHGDFVAFAIEQFADDPLTNFAGAAGDEKFHYAGLRAASQVNFKSKARNRNS